MKSKKVIWIVLLCFLMALGSFTAAKADTILFPIIAMGSPNITTVVSVITRKGAASPSTHLTYIYSSKDALVSGSPNTSGSCTKVSFTRPTFEGDLVSFDATGIFTSGNALFGDTNVYSGGFSLSGTGDRRAYLLVTNSNSSGTRVDVGNNIQLGGEAILMEIGYGAAWGYRGINDSTAENYTFQTIDDGGGIYNALPSNGYNSRRFTFFPPNEWTTRFFVTPLGSNMNSSDNTATINLYPPHYDRNATEYSPAAIDHSVKCTAAIDLEDLMDSTTWAAVQTIGGYTWLRVASGDAVVYKLEWVFEDSTYGGTNNNGYLFSNYDLP